MWRHGFIRGLLLCSFGLLAQALIFGVRERLTARVGDTGNIPFELCDLPRPSCTLAHSFKRSAPNPTCTLDRYGHCEVARAPDNDPLREGMDSGCELCVLVVHGVTERDDGPYAICQTSSSGSCPSSFWRKISTLKVVSGNEEPPTPTSMSVKVSTIPTTEEKETAYFTTKAVKPPTVLSIKYTEKLGSNDTRALADGGFVLGTWMIILICIIILLILILLIICIIKSQKGGKYNVYDKEKQLIKDIESTPLKDDGAFDKYQPPCGPDGEPLNDSEYSSSETDSLKEYADGETGKFDEEGSFIAQYGDNKKQRQPDDEQGGGAAYSTFV